MAEFLEGAFWFTRLFNRPAVCADIAGEGK